MINVILAVFYATVLVAVVTAVGIIVWAASVIVVPILIFLVLVVGIWAFIKETHSTDHESENQGTSDKRD